MDDHEWWLNDTMGANRGGARMMLGFGEETISTIIKTSKLTTPLQRIETLAI